MLNKEDLKEIAATRLDDAKVLWEAKRYQGAIYLCGYAVELALKFRICETLKWEAYPDKDNNYQSFKTHKLDILLKLSGCESEIKEDFIAEWSIVDNWNPETRYEPLKTIPIDKVENMINAATKLFKKLCEI